MRRAAGQPRLRGRLTALGLVVTVWLIVHAPGLALACSVCTAGRDEENQLAFLLSTIFMSALPLLVIGAGVFVLWRRVRALERDQGTPQPSAPGSTLSSASSSPPRV